MKHENREIIHPPPHRRQWSVWTWNTEARFSEVHYSPTTQTSRPKLSTHFLGALVTPLPPASSSSDAGWRFSFSGFRLGPPKKSPIPFCHVGVGRGHTGFPPAYLLLADQSKHNKQSLTWTHTSLLLKRTRYWVEHWSWKQTNII